MCRNVLDYSGKLWELLDAFFTHRTAGTGNITVPGECFLNLVHRLDVVSIQLLVSFSGGGGILGFLFLIRGNISISQYLKTSTKVTQPLIIT